MSNIQNMTTGNLQSTNSYKSYNTASNNNVQNVSLNSSQIEEYNMSVEEVSVPDVPTSKNPNLEQSGGFKSILSKLSIKKTGASLTNGLVAITSKIISVAKSIVNVWTELTAAQYTPYLTMLDKVLGHFDMSATDMVWNDMVKPFVKIDSGEELQNLIYESKGGQKLNENAYKFMQRDNVGYEVTEGVGRVLGILIFAAAGSGVLGAGSAGAAEGASVATETAEAASLLEKAKGFFDTMRVLRIATAGIAEAGDKTSEAWRVDDASIKDGIAYGVKNGIFESIQWTLGEAINCLKIGDMNSLKSIWQTIGVRAGLDGLDAAVDTPIRAIFKSYNGNTYSENFEAAGGWQGVISQFIVGAGMSAGSEIFSNFLGPKFKSIISKIFGKDEAPDMEVTAKLYDSVHGFQVSTDDFGGYYKYASDTGFFSKEQVQGMIKDANELGYMDMDIGTYLKNLFTDDCDIYYKQIHSSDLESIYKNGIYCNGTSTSGFGSSPTNVTDINLDNTLYKADGFFDLFKAVKLSNGVSAGGNPIDGAVILKIPKGTSIENMVVLRNGVYCIDPKYIMCSTEVDSKNIVKSMDIKNNVDPKSQLVDSVESIDNDITLTEVIKNSDANKKDLVNDIVNTIPAKTDDLTKARMIYLKLNESVSYSDSFFIHQRDFDPEFKLKEYNKVFDASNMDSSNVVCSSWTRLYKDLLVASGIDESKITIMGEGNELGHQWLKVDLGHGKLLFADGTKNYGSLTDLTSTKMGKTTHGFVITTEKDWNKVLNQCDDEYDAMYTLVITDNQKNLNKIDKKIGYGSNSEYNNKINELNEAYSNQQVDLDLVTKIDSFKEIFDSDMSAIDAFPLYQDDASKFFGRGTSVMLLSNREELKTVIKIKDNGEYVYLVKSGNKKIEFMDQETYSVQTSGFFTMIK